MKIYIVTPGHFYQGFNSRVRGEGRWLVHMAGVLVSQGHQVYIISTDRIRTYQDRGVWFTSIYDDNDPDCDLMISMDAWEDVPHLSKTRWSPMLNAYNPKKRVQALFFPTADEVYDYIPVIHPWNYEQVRKGLGHFIPVITHETCKPPGFDRNCLYWFSKRPNENPDYLLGVISAARELIVDGGSEALFVDGIYIHQGQYRNWDSQKEAATKALYVEILGTGRVDSLGYWAPYNYVRDVMSKTKMMIGIHHPVVAPSMAESAVSGAFPVLFENQVSAPPYDTIDIPYIPMSASDGEVKEFILQAWNDKDLFESTIFACQNSVQDHQLDRATPIIQKFIEEF